MEGNSFPDALRFNLVFVKVFISFNKIEFYFSTASILPVATENTSKNPSVGVVSVIKCVRLWIMRNRITVDGAHHAVLACITIIENLIS